MKVEPHNTGQECSRCSTIVPKTLNDRIHRCGCGLRIDRDVNAACIILKRALGQELSEVTPVEIGPLLPHALHGEASSVVEAGRSGLQPA